MARKLMFWTAIATTMAIAAVACQSPPDDLSEFEQPIQTREQLRIGVLMPESGSLATVGQPLMNALVLVRDRVNACGGVNQAPVALVTAETRSYPPVEADAMMRLVRGAQVHGAIAILSNDGTPRLISIANRNRVPLLSPTNANAPLVDDGEIFDGYWSRTVLSYQQEAIALAEMAIARGFDAIATVVSDTPDGIQFERAFTRRFEQLGGTVVNPDSPIRYEFQPFASEAEDARLPFGFGGEPFADDGADDADGAQGGTADPAAAQLFDRPPAAIAIFLDNRAGIDRVRAIANQGPAADVQWIVARTPTLVKMLKDEQFQIHSIPSESEAAQADNRHVLTGALGLSPRPKREAFQVLVQAWQSRFDEPMGAFVPQAWDAATLLMLAAEAGRDNDGKAIRSQLQAVANPPGMPVTEVCQGLEYLRNGESIDYQGASGALNLDSWGNVMGVTEFDLWQVTETGDQEIIDQITRLPAVGGTSIGGDD